MPDANNIWAFDIETDGLVEPIPTAVTLYDGENALCVFRESEVDADADAVWKSVQSSLDSVGVTVDMTLAADNWSEMADEMSSIFSNLDDSDTLVTYNGLSYRGGFDIPVLDYAYHQVDAENPVKGCMHTDVNDVVNRGCVYNTTPKFPKRGGPSKSDMKDAAERFELADEASGLNKAPLAELLNDELSAAEMEQWAQENDRDVPTTDVETLDDVYDYIYDEELPNPCDGSNAVETWRNGDYDDLLIHNISDCVKTHRLYEYVENSAIPYRRYEPERLG